MDLRAGTLLSIGTMCFIFVGSVAWAQGQQPGADSGAESDEADAEPEEEGYGDASFEPGGQVGFSPVAGENHYLLNLTIDAHLSALQTALRAPLRFEVSSGSIRRQDYDEAGDILRVGQCVRVDLAAPSAGGSRDGDETAETLFEKERGLCLPWGTRPDDYYVSVRLSKIADYTLGHGTVLTGFSNSTDVDHYNAGLVADLQLHEFIATQAVLDRLVARNDRVGPSVVGGRVAIRPYTRYSDEGTWAETVDQLEIGITGAADMRAPTDVTDADGDGLQADTAGNIESDDIDFGRVGIVGIDAVYRFRWGSALHVEARLDVNKIVNFGEGAHGQFWFVFHEMRFDARAEAEYRFVSPDYIPGYFDSAYGVASQQSNLGADASAGELPVTKVELLQALRQEAGAGQHGFRGGFVFDYYGSSGDYRQSMVQLRGGVDTVVGRESSTNLEVGLGIPRLGNKIDVLALYSSRNASGMRDLVSLDNTVTRLFVRWDLTSQFYVNLSFDRVWRFEEEIGFLPRTDAIASLGFQEVLAAVEGGNGNGTPPAEDAR